MANLKSFFVFNPASDPSMEDDEYVMIGHADITIQHAPYCPKPYITNRWVESEGAMYHYEFRTFGEAQAKAFELANIKA